MEVIISVLLMISGIVFAAIMSYAVLKMLEVERWYKMAYIDVLNGLKDLLDVETKQFEEMFK